MGPECRDSATCVNQLKTKRQVIYQSAYGPVVVAAVTEIKNSLVDDVERIYIEER